MTDCELRNVDPEDVEDLLVEIATSFNIRFVGKELVHIKTFGQFCDHITDKIQLVDSDTCTSQQAFYKLRNAIVSTLHIDRTAITTDLLLIDFLPRQTRRSRTKKL